MRGAENGGNVNAVESLFKILLSLNIIIIKINIGG